MWKGLEEEMKEHYRQKEHHMAQGEKGHRMTLSGQKMEMELETLASTGF